MPATNPGQLGRAFTAALHGVEARLVTVEANVGPGLPGVHVVGMGDTAVRESRDRIKTAAAHSMLDWPRTKIVISMSPASLPKAGSGFDLAMALAVLSAAHGGAGRGRLATSLVIGEVGLDGTLREINGVLPAALSACQLGFDTIVVPPGNAAEAAVLSHPQVLVAENLKAAWRWVTGGTLPGPGGAGAPPVAPVVADLADVSGQPLARRALEVAAAGGHHMMMVGPPGSGKSMLAQRMPGILPPLTEAEMIAATAVHSVAGQTGTGPITRAPFVAPHHTTSLAGLIGGGSGRPRPGAVSLAHHGVLFLDEVSEVPALVLDGLREPLERGEVVLTRARSQVVLPAEFQLVMAANPCRCGAEHPASCRCSSVHRRTYLQNLSGPLLDRVDIRVDTTASAAVVGQPGESSAAVAERVAAARERGYARWQRVNGRIPGPVLRRRFPASPDAMALIEAYLAEGSLTQRGVDRTLRLAWTLADLTATPRPTVDHVYEAIGMHTGPELRTEEAA